MHRESQKNNGTMHAIVGLPFETLQRIVCSVQSEGIAAVANYNTEKQIVITGSPALVEKISEIAMQEGAKAVPLKVSGAWHSRLIQGAEQEFSDYLASVSFHDPICNIILNVTAETEQNPATIRSIMSRQICSPVLWYPAMKLLLENPVDAVVEVGPGKVLTGLMKQILPKDHPCKIYSANSLKNIEHVIREIKE